MAGMLDGKVALVTGAGHGIGRSHALELAKHGAKVVVNDLGGSHTGEGTGRVADEVVAIIKARGGEAVADFGDVSNEAQADAMVRRGVEEWGRFDILVNNAGIVRDKTIWNMTVEDFDLVVAVHFKGSWLTCRSAARHWREEAKANGTGKVYGRIINTTSGAGLTGNFGQSNYAPAKAALASLSQTLSLELASIGVTVNTISPGAITRLSAAFSKADSVREADDYAEGEWDPTGPTVSSPVVAWLGSDEAAHVSGMCLRPLGEKLHLMKGWSEERTITTKKGWDATTLGRVLGTDIFCTRTPGMR